MIKFFKLMLCMAVALSLASCNKVYGEKGIIKSKKHAYKQSENGKRLAVPADLNYHAHTRYYDLPENKKAVADDISIIPPSSTLNKA